MHTKKNVNRPFVWDHYSDQPYPLKDRAFKKMMRRRNFGSLLKTVFISLVILPLSLLWMPLLRRRRDIDSKKFFGISVNLNKEPELTIQLIKELGVNSLLIRLPLWDIENIDRYINFIKQFGDREILINIMQDREHIEDLELLKKHIELIFKQLSPYVSTFQIGTTINRAKWGFFSVNEYLSFYEVAYKVRDIDYPNLKLIGPSVIDFEYHFTAHALFNLSSIKFDALSALLYVDRRGAPENSQMGFDLTKKINFLASMALLSPKTSSKIYLTETNWPLEGTAPYAPTSEFECISEDDYADFMIRYYLLSFASQRVDAIFWHQLISSGYGLIDIRDGVRKRSAFTAFKTMLEHFQDAKFIGFVILDNLYKLTCQNQYGHFNVLWTKDNHAYSDENYVKIFGQDGRSLDSKSFLITSSVVYAYYDYKGNN